jgi:hypothetical protein
VPSQFNKHIGNCEGCERSAAAAVAADAAKQPVTA